MMIVVQPVASYAGNGIDFSGQVSLLSETRTAGSFLLASRFLILSGAFLR